MPLVLGSNACAPKKKKEIITPARFKQCCYLPTTITTTATWELDMGVSIPRRAGPLQRVVGSILRVQEVKADAKLRVSIRSVLVLAGHVLRILVLLITSSFGPLGVEQTETVGEHGLLSLLFDRLRRRNERRRPTLGQGNITFVVEEPDLAAFVLNPRHHACAGKCRVADRVCVEVGVGSMELDVNDDKV